MKLQKFLFILLLVPGHLLGLNSGQRGAYIQKIKDAKGAAEVLQIVTQIATIDPLRVPSDFPWFSTNVKREAMAKGLTEQQWWQAQNIQAPGKVTDANLNAAIKAVEGAALEVAKAVSSKPVTDPNNYAARQAISDSLGDLLRTVNMRP